MTVANDTAELIIEPGGNVRMIYSELIEPHALGYDGFRWHARARDAEDGAFKDYVLGRLSGASLQGPRRSAIQYRTGLAWLGHAHDRAQSRPVTRAEEGDRARLWHARWDR